ncbi:MAG: hypothetical protein ACAH80_17820 [Alphaproteobacteria bacterium]
MQKETLQKFDGLLIVLLLVMGGAYTWFATTISWTAQLYRAVHAGMLYMLPATIVAGVAAVFVLSMLAVLLKNGRNTTSALLAFADRRRLGVLISLVAGYWYIAPVLF